MFCLIESQLLNQDDLSCISMLFIEKSFLNNYDKTMLARYLVLLGATNLRKSYKSVKAVNFP